jgi:ABC-2 type transport system ATP-binding protein
VDPGEILGIVGPNGAGKSTLIKMLVGILKPDRGAVSVNGWDPFRDRRRFVREIGVVFGQRTPLLWDLAAAESFELHRRIYQMGREDFTARFRELAGVFGLQDFLAQPVRTLSLGQRVRATIALALLPRPRLLFLDEPTVGLDVMAVDRLTGILKELNRGQGVTLLVTSHDLGFIERLCRRMVLFDRGSALFDGGVDTAIRQYGSYKKLKLIFPGDGLPEDLDQRLPRALKLKEAPANRVEAVFNESELPYGEVLRLIQSLAADFPRLEFFLEKPTLNEVILHAFR